MSLHPWLQNAWSIFQDRLENDQMAHALLIQGPEGTGKNNLARFMMARMLCTETAGFACGACRSCSLFATGAHPDAFVLVPGEGKHQIVIEQVRSMIESLTLTTSFSPTKVALISPAEAMNLNSANALLKSLEEPPGDTVLILVSHNPSGLPVTIRSRCQSIAVALPGTEVATNWLINECQQSPETARNALAAAGGSPLRALQMAASGQVQAHQDLQMMLSSIISKPTLVSGAASELSKIEPADLWTWLSNSCAEALRSSSAGNPSSWLNAGTELERDSLARLQQKADRNRVFSRSAVRQDLLLQEWLIKWSQLAA
jgi:DNA polymerase-3 subunit delta'